ncbi:histidinol-phosphate transaminase [Bradyrhizobium sp. CCGE-LA001]|uniref:histidinol-phosphate transaminase n=1 Tax=Bradyrhizobium sp. CCGE-LA001 TaxID=1223566 RepID=UPI000745AF58|nr:histidinol-phosphate transaminase [Bradyrhizobium sp. CCGE-LA001]AMA59830.1 histidinol-phosphate aminotransferase [Bradyrhizobium sp. CCGE-LA001]
MTDAKIRSLLSSLTPIARELDALPAGRPAPADCFMRLNANENPFPLPSIVMRSAITALERQYLYPEHDNITLREAAAAAYGMSADRVMAGNGSSELLSLVYRAFLTPGDSIAMLSPGFSFNRKLASLQGAQFIEVRGNELDRLPIDRFLFGPAKHAKFILLANPNNPTGAFVPVAEIERLVAKYDRLVVLDEAYVDFAPENGLHLVNRYSNLLILRTFSKSYATAGIRIGFAFGHPELIGRLRNFQNMFNMSVIGHAVGMSVLSHRRAYDEILSHIKDERQRVSGALSEFGFSVIPSHANFLLARVPAGQDGKWWQSALERQRILVAFFPNDGLEDCIRVSIGTRNQMDAFLEAIDKIRLGADSS